MDILKTSIDWAKAEVFSATFFIAFSVAFIMASILFWQLGKTEIARAYITPTAVVGMLLLIIGLGLFYANIKRISEFETAYNRSESNFVESELLRAERTLNEYRTIVFKAIPLIIATCAFVMLFVEIPIVRASLITTIAMMTVILLIDGTAHARMDTYNDQLRTIQTQRGG